MAGITEELLRENEDVCFSAVPNDSFSWFALMIMVVKGLRRFFDSMPSQAVVTWLFDFHLILLCSCVVDIFYTMTTIIILPTLQLICLNSFKFFVLLLMINPSHETKQISLVLESTEKKRRVNVVNYRFQHAEHPIMSLVAPLA